MLTEPQHATEVSDEVATDASGDGSWTRRIETVVRSLQVRFGVGIDPALDQNRGRSRVRNIRGGTGS